MDANITSNWIPLFIHTITYKTPPVIHHQNTNESILTNLEICILVSDHQQNLLLSLQSPESMKKAFWHYRFTSYAKIREELKLPLKELRKKLIKTI